LVDDPERCEYFVPVHWLQTVPLEQGRPGDRHVREPEYRLQTDHAKVALHGGAAEGEFPDFNK